MIVEPGTPPKSEAGQQPSDQNIQVHGVRTVHHDLNTQGCKTLQSNHAEQVITINFISPAVVTNIPCILVTGDI
jgi:hypothetical protein